MNVLLKLAVTVFYIWIFTVAVTSFKPNANMRSSGDYENLLQVHKGGDSL